MSPTITVAMTDSDVIERVAKLWGAKVRSKPPRHGLKQVFTTSVAGVTAARWMLRLQHLLGERRWLKVQQIINEWQEYARTRVLNYRAERDRGFVIGLLCIEKSVDELLREREEKNKKKDAERVRLYYRDNPEKGRSAQRRSYQKHIDKRRAWAREYRRKNKERMIAYNREYKAKNKEKLREYGRERRERMRTTRELIDG